MTTKTRILMFAAIGATFAVVGAAPFVLMLLPNPKPVTVADVASQMPGTYVRTAGRTYHVFPHADRAESFPDDALKVGPDVVFVIKYRQLAELNAYTLWSFDGGREIDVERDLHTPELLQIKPLAELPPGRYYAVVAKESIYGGEDYFYFSVSGRGAAP